MSQTERRAIRQVVIQILAGYGFDGQSAAPIADKVADGVIALKPPKKQRRQNDDLFPVARALAEVCYMDFNANKGQLFHEAKQLAQATPPATPELIKAHYDASNRARPNWYDDDYRGRQREYPKPSYIRQTWAQMISGETKSDNARQAVVVT